MAFLISATVMLFVVFVVMSLGEHWHAEDEAAGGPTDPTTRRDHAPGPC
ncbi:hypothetical protein [Nocardioides sambongensis]|nr:hypothetical protein [Nocardioides sambongensis]